MNILVRKSKKAKVITISIGGNDLLGPIVDVLGGLTPGDLQLVLNEGLTPELWIPIINRKV
jgi:hypothetical protein